MQIQDGVFGAALRRADIKPAARIAFRKIAGAQQARLVRHVVEDLLAVPAVVPPGQDVDAALQQSFRDARSNAKTGSGVFAVGDDQIDLAMLHKVGQAVVDDLASGRANNISDEQHLHGTGIPLGAVFTLLKN